MPGLLAEQIAIQLGFPAGQCSRKPFAEKLLI